MIPGQISIVGFSGFIFANATRKALVARIFAALFLTCRLPVTAGHWQNARHENVYLINHNSVRGIDRDSFICAKPRHVARGCIDSAAQPAAPTGQPNPQEMMKQMMEMSKLNENHKLLADMNGNWNYTIKFWMNPDPNAPPQESKGTATRKSVMGGRYVVMDVSRQNADAGSKTGK